MDSILNRPEITHLVADPAQQQDNVTPLLNQCVGMLRDLGSKKIVQPEDLRKLDATVKGYSERYACNFDQRSTPLY